jgi:tight adherence protein C
MSRIAVACGLLVWVGATLLLSRQRWASRPSLSERLRPFSPGATSEPIRSGMFSVESFRDVLLPLVKAGGDRLASLFGISEPLDLRLRRIHSDVEPAAFRLRQAAAAGAGLLVGAGLAGLTGAELPMALLLVFGGPLLCFLVVEQRLARASEAWQKRLAYETPVVAEQLAMLLNSGYSLGSALSRLAERSRGCVATDLETVVNRVRQGLSEADALREWAGVAGVDAVERLVGVLTLHSQAADLGRLVSSEARQSRRDLHRRTVEAIERRSEQVWVPVTIATLVPGVILLAVPFLSALRLFSNA